MLQQWQMIFLKDIFRRNTVPFNMICFPRFNIIPKTHTAMQMFTIPCPDKATTFYLKIMLITKPSFHISPPPKKNMIKDII